MGQERFAERFIGPYARTHLNSPSILKEAGLNNTDEEGNEELLASEQQSNYLMQQYFKLVNTHMHGMPGGRVESESFSHDFRLPKCYDIPKFKETAALPAEGGSLSAARCKQFPDKVLFYVFYNMPHDKAQLNASIEL